MPEIILKSQSGVLCCAWVCASSRISGEYFFVRHTSREFLWKLEWERINQVISRVRSLSFCWIPPVFYSPFALDLHRPYPEKSSKGGEKREIVKGKSLRSEAKLNEETLSIYDSGRANKQTLRVRNWRMRWENRKRERGPSGEREADWKGGRLTLFAVGRSTVSCNNSRNSSRNSLIFG